MKLNKQQVEQLMYICEWVLDYDEDLPNRDGEETDNVVNNAHRFSRFIDNHEDES